MKDGYGAAKIPPTPSIHITHNIPCLALLKLKHTKPTNNMSAELPEHYKDHRVLLELELAIDELAEHKSTKLTCQNSSDLVFFTSA